jgi:hypothetical protein
MLFVRNLEFCSLIFWRNILKIQIIAVCAFGQSDMRRLLALLYLYGWAAKKLHSWNVWYVTQHLAVSTARRPQGVVRGSPMIRPLARPPSSSSFLFFLLVCLRSFPGLIYRRYTYTKCSSCNCGKFEPANQRQQKRRRKRKRSKFFFVSFFFLIEPKNKGGKVQKNTRIFTWATFISIYFFLRGAVL